MPVLTRLEVDGFKNLNGFVAEFGAFTCIAGENGVGKSNVFDAIEFLALIASNPLMDAAQQIRSTRADSAGDPRDLFPNGRPEDGPMMFRAEMIVPGEVADDFDAHIPPAITFLRYEVDIGYAAAEGTQRHGRLVVNREHLEHINLGDAARHLGFRHEKAFRTAVVRGRRAAGPFISTAEGEARIDVHQDGGSRGRPKRALPVGANTTVVSTVNTIDNPTILAARREMQSWRRLALEPTALRAGDRYVDPPSLTADGHHLAAALYRIASTPDAQGQVHAEDVYARVTGRLAGLTGVNAGAVRVDADDTRQLLTLIVTDLEGNDLPARSLSEGTLRYLALCVMLEDSTVTGLICMEEPENGIHPGNLEEMVNLVRDLAVDPSEPPSPDNPLRQVIVNTHSPGIVQLIAPDDLLLATETLTGPLDGVRRRELRLSGVVGTWRDGRDGPAGALRASFIDYLTKPPRAQFELLSDDVA